MAANLLKNSTPSLPAPVDLNTYKLSIKFEMAFLPLV
jgi:hypothetical protein